MTYESCKNWFQMISESFKHKSDEAAEIAATTPQKHKS